MEMSTGVSLLRTAQSLLTGRTIENMIKIWPESSLLRLHRLTSPEPIFLVRTKNGTWWRVRPNVRHVAPLWSSSSHAEVRPKYIVTVLQHKKWVWSWNTTIAHCRLTDGTVRKSHRILTVTCLIWFFTFHQQSFSHIGTGLPGLNQY